jgi:hypothetical protein
MKQNILIRSFALLCLFSFIAIGLQFTGLEAPMYYDSGVLIFKRQGTFAEGLIPKIMGIFPQRPVPILSFYLNYLIGGMSPVYFRLVNQVLLAAAAVLVVLVIEMVLDLPGPWRRGTVGDRRIVSTALGLLFLVHPFQIFLTLYVWQRMALMACLFAWASLALYLAVRTDRIGNKGFGYFGVVIFFVLACLSKENAAVVPAVFLLAEIAFFQSYWRRVILRAAIYCAFLMVLIGLLSLLEAPHGKPELGSGILTVIVKYYKESGHTFWEVLLTQCRVLFFYLFAIAFPVPASVQLIRPQILSTSTLEPPETLAAVVGAAALATAGVWLLRKRPLVGFGLLFFMVSLLPESFLVPQFAYFGYRAVFPMFGLCFVAADGILALFTAGRNPKERRWARAGCMTLLLVTVVSWAFVTVQKSTLWGTPLKLWRDVVSQFPHHANAERLAASHALVFLGAAEAQEGNRSAAASSFIRAIRANPNYPEAHYNLGKVLLSLGLVEESLVPLRKALQLKPDFWQAHNNLGVAMGRLGRPKEAVVQFEKALKINPHDVPTRNNLQAALREIKKLEEREGKSARQ